MNVEFMLRLALRMLTAISLHALSFRDGRRREHHEAETAQAGQPARRARATAQAAPGLVAGRAGLALVSAPAKTPIKHVVVIIGENHTFDNVFATYQPPGHQEIKNLLSEGIVTPNGTPGPHYASATQLTANQFIADAETGSLPAVSFLKPGDDDGHPGYSTLAAFENFTARAQPGLGPGRRAL